MPADSAVPESDVTTFAALGVPAPLVEILQDQGITVPFPVQAATLPDGLAGRDILGRAETGSGKTLGFSLPLVSRLTGGSTASRRPRGLILVPTRELATQVTTVLKPLARAMGLWVTTIYGGVAYGPQVSALQHKTDIIVATPGRLADLIGQRECDLRDVQVTVIDEADQMADLGFLPIVQKLLETTPPEGQRMLFSATLDAAIDVLARRFLNDPVLHTVDENSSPAVIEHHVFTIEAASRVAVIAALAGGEQRSLVFTKTKHGAERLARQLTEAGIPAAELHGNLRQGARARNLAAFATGLARVMVATDVAARGIHIDGIDLIVHADPPAEHKSYVHRSGRTARGGAEGVVVTVQTKAQAREVTAMMRKAGITPHEPVTVDADSGVLAEIAGPPAPRVAVTGKVSELVHPEDRLASNHRPGTGKPWEGRPRRDSKPGNDRFRAHGSGGPGSRGTGPRGSGSRGEDRGGDGSGPARAERFDRDERAPRFTGDERSPRSTGDERSPRSAGDERGPRFESGSRRDQPAGGARDNRAAPGRDSGGRTASERRNSGGGYDWWPRTKDRQNSWNRNDRPGSYRGGSTSGGRPAGADRAVRDDRPARDERPYRAERGPQGQPSGRPAPAGQSPRPRAGRADRPQAGGHFGGSSRRPGYSAGQGGAGKRRG